MATAIPASMRALMNSSLINVFTDKALWLVMLKQQRADCSQAECLQCGALSGAVLFPGLTTLQPETLTEAIDNHQHWNFVDVEVARVSAHTEMDTGKLRIVPDEDRVFSSTVDAVYQIAVYHLDIELARVDVGAMSYGSSLNTMAMSMEIADF